jgi:hypothetical protein
MFIQVALGFTNYGFLYKSVLTEDISEWGSDKILPHSWDFI